MPKNPFVGGPRQRGKSEKPRDFKKTFKRLWSYLMRYKGYLFVALFLNIIANVLALFGPKLSGFAIDAIDLGQGKVDFEKVFYFCGLMAIFYATSGVLSYIIQYLMIKTSKNIVYDMRKEAFDKIADMKVSYFDNNPIGDIISRITYDVDTINTSLSSDFITMCSSLITIVGAFIMMMSISQLLVLVFVVTIPLSMIYTRHMLKITKPLFGKRSRELGRLNGFSEEMISGNRSIHSYAKEDYVIDKYKDINADASNAAYKADYYGAMTGPALVFSII